jgi:DNA-directed RNA polymerase specialized sigma24 family protein
MTVHDINESVPGEELITELYDALHSISARCLSRASRLDPTDLIHHAWVRLSLANQFDSMPRSEFLALCATVMRRIAVDEGRRRVLERRDPERITLSGLAGSSVGVELDMLALDDALVDL